MGKAASLLTLTININNNITLKYVYKQAQHELTLIESVIRSAALTFNMTQSLFAETFWKPFEYTYGTVILLGICSFLFLRWISTRPRNYPPGPYGLPIVGYLPFLSKQPYLDLKQLSKNYGNVFSLRLGSQNAVVLCDFPAVKEALTKDAFLGRPPDIQFQPIPDIISLGIISGRWWKEQRRFSLHVLRNLGFGKTKMEEHIKDEISVILDHLTKLNGSACDVREILVPSMSNNISSLVFGQRFDYDDPKRKFLNERLEEFTEYFRQFSLNTFFPWMKPLLPILKPRNFEKFRETVMKLQSFISNEIKCHEESLDQNCIRDYIDSFLIEMKDRQKENNVSSFTYSMLNGNVQALFGAGSGTVRITIEWCLLTMAAYSDVQKLVQKEIDSVIGSERSPSWADHKNLPYTEAVIFEVQRWQTITPLNLLRYTTEDTSVQGYNIPKGTFVLTNIWAVHHDHRYWKNPDTFFPEHFLSQDGTTMKKPEYFIPFSIGKRSCPGETLGLIEVFLYFTSILQRFTVALPDGEKPNFDGTCELTWEAKFHHLRLLPRN